MVIYPNNDHGTDIILEEYKRFKSLNRIRIFPSIRFEYFLVLLKNSQFMLGNSSAGVREAPFYGLPSINIGSRQNNRSVSRSVINVKSDYSEIISAINGLTDFTCQPYREFGEGNSDSLFMNALNNVEIWETSQQKLFNDFEVGE